MFPTARAEILSEGGNVFFFKGLPGPLREAAESLKPPQPQEGEGDAFPEPNW